MKGPALAAALLMGCLACVRAETEVYIGLTGTQGSSQLSIGMPPFLLDHGAKAESARTLREVVRDDLMFSRHFKALEPPSAGAAADPKAYTQEWKNAGAGFVLSAKVSETPPKVSIAVALLDLSSGENVLERYYRQDARYWRSAAHQISDDIVKQLTGKPGIAHTQIAFVNNQTGSKEVYIVDYDGENLRRLTTDHSINLLPRWNPNRTRILYTSYKRLNPDLYEIDLERGSNSVFLDRQGLNLAGGFSPDATRLVLTLSRQKNPNLFLMDTQSRSLKQLTDHFGVDTSPTFSPDGRQISFVSDRSGNPQIYILDLTSNKTHRLTRLNWCDTPSWSPTGEWIAFAGRANRLDRMDIFLVDITGEHVRQLTHGEGSNEDPSWAPDGRFITFSSNRNKRRQIFIMDADGSAPRLVGDIPGQSFTPAWSP